MYERFIDNLLLGVLDKIVYRILHEIMWLFEIDTINKTSNNVVN